MRLKFSEKESNRFCPVHRPLIERSQEGRAEHFMPDQFDWRMVEREASPGRAVGRLLCDQREALGYSVADVAQRLRIRPAFIEAIESGRFDLLPGAAYIPAFLRAYATHVGLDPQKVLSAYQLSGAVPIERPVTLPTAAFPMVERRAPVGLAVLTVILVVAAGYSVWRYMPVEQVTVAEKVPPVPDRLMASQPPAAPAASAVSTTPAAPEVETAVAPPAPADAWPKTKPEAPKQDAPKVDSAAAPAAAAPQTATAPVQSPAAVTPPIAPLPYVSPYTTPGQAQAAQPPAPSAMAPAAPAAPQQATAIEPPRVDAAIPVKRDTLVSVKANSWVELRGPNGDVLAQTYVRAGESYTIPAGIAYSVTSAR
jgi:cytoskeleton protein RodZ